MNQKISTSPLTGEKVEDLNAREDVCEVLHKSRMAGILVEVIVSIFLVVELGHENMSDAPLGEFKTCLLAKRKGGDFWGIGVNSKGERKKKKGEISNLTTFGTVVSTAHERLDIRFLGGGVYTFVFQTEHVLAGLWIILLSAMRNGEVLRVDR